MYRVALYVALLLLLGCALGMGRIEEEISKARLDETAEATREAAREVAEMARAYRELEKQLEELARKLDQLLDSWQQGR